MGVYKNCDYEKIKMKFYDDIYTEKCECDYCINFFNEFPKKYTETLQLFEEFKTNVLMPLEICYLGIDEYEDFLHRYIAYYAIKGDFGQNKILIKKEGLEIAFRNLNCIEMNEFKERLEDDYFIMEINGILIPWEKNLEL